MRNCIGLRGLSRCLFVGSLFVGLLLPPPGASTEEGGSYFVRRGLKKTKYEDEYEEYAFASVGQTETCRVFSLDIMNGDGTLSSELQCVPDIETTGEESLAYVLEGLPPSIENANKTALEHSEVYLKVSDVTKTKCHRSTFVNPFETTRNNGGGSDRRLADKRKKKKIVCKEKIIVDSDSEVEILPTPPNIDHQGSNRQLNTKQQRNVLILRISSEDKQLTKTAATLSNTAFGTSGTVTNFASQYSDCSNGDLTFVEATGRNIVDGVAEIKLDMSVVGRDAGTVMNAATVAATETLDSFPDKYDHVLYCLPPGTTKSGRYDWIAFGYFNYYRTVYNDRWCTSLSVKMHEVGHNLGLAHSGEGKNKYGDTSGLMGKSFAPEDGPKMCFNAAKSWDLNWYSDRRQVVDLTTGPKLLNFAGIVDYSKGQTTENLHTVLAKIPEITSRTDLYLMYNDASGFNSETKEFRNRVTVVEAAAKSTSYVRGNLTAGQIYRKPNFNGTSQDLVIEMCDFVKGSPSLARVLFFIDEDKPFSCLTLKEILDDVTPTPPTFSPSAAPNNSPSGGRFDVTPWTQPTETPTVGGGRNTPSKSPTKKPTLYESFDPIQFSPTLISVSTTCGIENEFCSGQWRVCCEGFRCNTEYRRCRSTGRFPRIKVDTAREGLQ